jgi:hypothetical protein
MRETEMMTHHIQDGSRIRRFEGALIAHSTSWKRGSSRWVEFSLYRTVSGSYVLSRIGMSLLFHDPDCPVAERNDLPMSPAAALDPAAQPCFECSPDSTQDGEICAETPRTWAHVSDTPEGIVDALQRNDSHGSRYLTRVAQRLLEEAAGVDPAIDAVYRVEHIA